MIATTAYYPIAAKAKQAREDPRDVLIVSHVVEAESIAELPAGSRVGTSSLHRLDSAGRITAYLEAPAWLPAAGQGAIAVQIRDDDEATRAAVIPLNDPHTERAVRAERAFLAALGGECQVPIGALAIGHGVAGTLYGLIANVRGSRVIRGECPLGAGDPERTGPELAQQLRDQGAEEMLAELRHLRSVPPPRPE